MRVKRKHLILAAAAAFCFLLTILPVMAVEEDEECAGNIMAALARGDAEKAESLAADCEDEFPESVSTLDAAGYFHLSMGDIEGAVKKFEAASEIDPEDLAPRHLLVYAYLLKGDTAAARNQAEYIAENEDLYEDADQVLRVAAFNLVPYPAGLKKNMETISESTFNNTTHKDTSDYLIGITVIDGVLYQVMGGGRVIESKNLITEYSYETLAPLFCSLAGCVNGPSKSTSNSRTLGSRQEASEYTIRSWGTIGWKHDSVESGKNTELKTKYKSSSTQTVMNDPPTMSTFPAIPGETKHSIYAMIMTSSSSMDGCYETLEPGKNTLGSTVKTNIQLNLFGTAKKGMKVKQDCMENQAKSSGKTDYTLISRITAIETVETPAGTFHDCLKVESSSEDFSTGSSTSDTTVKDKKTSGDTSSTSSSKSTSTSWSCPFVGNVKGVSSTSLGGGKSSSTYQGKSHNTNTAASTSKYTSVLKEFSLPGYENYLSALDDIIAGKAPVSRLFELQATALAEIDGEQTEEAEADDEEMETEDAAKPDADAGKLADAAFDGEDYERAAELYEQVLGERPKDASAHYNLGMCYEEMGENEKAVEHYLKYLKLSPNAEDAEEVEGWIEELEK